MLVVLGRHGGEPENAGICRLLYLQTRPFEGSREAMDAIGNRAQRRRVIVALAINASYNLIHGILANDREMGNGILQLVRLQLLMLLRRLRGVRFKPTRITGYLGVTIPNMTGMQFRQHFRMRPEVYEALERRLGPLLTKQSHFGRPSIPVRTQLLVTLWLLATPDSYR